MAARCASVEDAGAVPGTDRRACSKRARVTARKKSRERHLHVGALVLYVCVHDGSTVRVARSRPCALIIAL